MTPPENTKPNGPWLHVGSGNDETGHVVAPRFQRTLQVLEFLPRVATLQKSHSAILLTSHTLKVISNNAKTA